MTAKLMGLFPRLKAGEYRVTSPRTKRYNCIAWAAGVVNQWWEPTKGYHWPRGVPRKDTIAAIMALFIKLGYKKCKDGSLEQGFEKVAIYGDIGGYNHAAKQLPNGKWSSKIGSLEDMEHDSLDCLVGTRYGTVVRVLKRRVANTTSVAIAQTSQRRGNVAVR